MFSRKRRKVITHVVLVAYLSLLNVQTVQAAQAQAIATGHLWAQAGRGLQIDSGQPSAGQPAQEPPTALTAEDRNARASILNGKIQRLDEEINEQKGARRNLLNTALAAFSIGATLTFGVNRVNAAIDDISASNPEDHPAATLEERLDDCRQYECSTSEKQDALKSLDGIKGIGGGIFIVGAAALAGYGLYTWRIHNQQRDIESLRQESDSLFESRSLTPEYLQQNESVAVVIDEIEGLQKKSGAMRTQEELFLRVAVGSAASGLFLMGLSNVSHTIVGNISIDETNLNDVTAKQNALKRTDELQTAGGLLLGASAAAGITSFIFGRFARRHDDRIDDLEDSLWRVVERLEWRPKMNGFTVMYRQTF